jgi:plastocyanin
MKKIKQTIKNKAFILFALVGLFILFAGCSSKSDPAANEVYIQNMAFAPATITVTVGTTVKWTNKDGVAHTVTSDTGSTTLNSGNIISKGVFSFMFTAAGTYNYHCAIHPGMTGKVVVN